MQTLKYIPIQPHYLSTIVVVLLAMIQAASTHEHEIFSGNFRVMSVLLMKLMPLMVLYNNIIVTIDVKMKLV